MMKTNESNIDRVIRVVVGLALLVLAFLGVVPGTLGLIFKIVGALALLTGMIGFCPVYALFHIRTNKA
jgi:hypothetical protein